MRLYDAGGKFVGDVEYFSWPSEGGVVPNIHGALVYAGIVRSATPPSSQSASQFQWYGTLHSSPRPLGGARRLVFLEKVVCASQSSELSPFTKLVDSAWQIIANSVTRQNGYLFSALELSCVLEDTAEPLFDPTIQDDFVTCRIAHAPASNISQLERLRDAVHRLLSGNDEVTPPVMAKRLRSGVTRRWSHIDIPDAHHWATAMAELFTRSRDFQQLVENCIVEGHRNLCLQHPDEPGFLHDGASLPGTFSQMVERAHRVLISDPLHVSWVGVTFFSFGRIIATNSSRGFSGTEWMHSDILWLDLDNAFVLAKQRRFRRLLLEELPKHFALAEFVSRVGGHAAATVATMAAIAG